MSPVSSSTLTCASARWRSARGSTSNSGSWSGSVVLGAGGLIVRRHRLGVGVVVAGSPGIGSTSTRPGHGFTIAGEQREVLAQRVALELGGR